jgi:hypothetical protein
MGERPTQSLSSTKGERGASRSGGVAGLPQLALGRGPFARGGGGQAVLLARDPHDLAPSMDL